MANSDRIVVGSLDESFHRVVAAVVAEVLGRLGHETVPFVGMHEEMYARLGRGELDLFADSWLPHSQGLLWEPVKDRVIEVGQLYKGARYFWAVPCYLPSSEVTEIGDLADQDVALDMATQTIVGAPEAAGLTRWSREVIRAYQLDRAGWTYRSADVPTVIRTVEQRMCAGDWFVTPLWVPQYLDDVYEMRRLEDPLRVFPPADRASIVAYAESFAALPARTRETLGRIRFELAHVSAMDATVNLEGLSPREAARQWMDENEALVRTWLGRPQGSIDTR